jgi:phenylacetate-CoA ligase
MKNNFFENLNFEILLKNIKEKKENFWIVKSKKEMFDLFKSASKRVPAYKDFLKKNKINPEKIKKYEDLKFIPPINKNNYIKNYDYNDLTWDGNLKKPLTIHSTSGSTGEPTYFNRNIDNDVKRAFIINYFLNNNINTIKKPTLFIIAFGMGVWSAGTGIYNALYLANNKNNLPISIISPGVNKIEILKAVKNLHKYFNQIIIAGYPPLIKDIIDEIIDEKIINLKKTKMRFVFTGEAFPEELRDFLNRRINLDNILTDTMNTYGTSELGATAIETPISILIKRLSYKNKDIFKDIFGDINKTPTLCQYIPNFVNFECINGELFFYGNGSMPLVKYESGDNGGLLNLSFINNVFKEHNIDLNKEFIKYKIENYINELPFVYVYERKNLAATFYGILIYPEYIKKILLKEEFSKFFTGKFTMITKYDKKQNQFLEINIELKKNAFLSKKDKKNVLEKIVYGLKSSSSEYRELSNHLKKRAYPKLKFWSYGYAKYFSFGNKHKWVQKK